MKIKIGANVSGDIVESSNVSGANITGDNVASSNVACANITGVNVACDADVVKCFIQVVVLSYT